MSKNLLEKDLLDDLELIEKFNAVGLPNVATTKEIAKAIASCTTMNMEEDIEFLSNKGVDF